MKLKYGHRGANQPVLETATENGFCQKGEDVTVPLRGGELLIRYTDDGVWMTGDARKNFEGVVEF
ncbi:hypothetical protein SDC9_138277 [bioreactor metagenome]|uniref:Diaminopimelate epimerase n=1 Tax=bioreactor metagenome TaxID=1076179 RepID=A0A645DPD7_9ZZZZ|nr:hypothetical protein [Christensenella sp.]